MVKRKRKTNNSRLSNGELIVLVASWAIMVPAAFLLRFLMIFPLVYFVIILVGFLLLVGAVKTDAAKRPVLFFSVIGAVSAAWLAWEYRDIFQY